MKPIYVTFALLVNLLSASKTYLIQPAKADVAVLPKNVATVTTEAVVRDYVSSSTAAILTEADQLVQKYGTRPYWPNLPFSEGEDVPPIQAPDVVAHLIPCESLNRDISVIDSNRLPSRGRLMFQDATWADFERKSGIYGDPMNPTTTVAMGIWAVENGYLDRWSCSYILFLVN